MSEQQVEQQNPHTKELTLPISGSKVVIKTMITGAEREQIDSAQYSTAKVGGKGDIQITDVAGALNAEKHKTLDIFIVSIDGSKIDCRQRLMKMYEEDTQFVIDAINELQKKTKSPMKDS